jgi:hypothetical protein
MFDPRDTISQNFIRLKEENPSIDYRLGEGYTIPNSSFIDFFVFVIFVVICCLSEFCTYSKCSNTFFQENVSPFERSTVRERNKIDDPIWCRWAFEGIISQRMDALMNHYATTSL